MCDPKPAYPIALTAEEVTQLKLLVRAHTTPQTLAVRARIILRAHDYPEESNQQIAAGSGTTDRTVRTWRRPINWPTRLAAGHRGVFHLRCARKSRPSPVVCRNSAKFRSRDGVELNWSVVWPKTRCCLASQLARWAAGTIAPGNTSMTRSPSCNAPVQYWKPMPRPERFCVQAPGWSASMKKPPFKPVRASSHHVQHVQVSRCCMKRGISGACHLFAGLSIADGKVYGICRQRKCFVDFQAFVQQDIIPEALRRQMQTVTLILDNGTTHAPKQLERWLKAQEQACEGRLHFQVHWLPPDASWLDQIEIWFSLLQRKCLQPNQFVSPSTLETALSEYITYYNQTAKPIK